MIKPSGFAALFAEKLCFSEGFLSNIAAMALISGTGKRCGGIAAINFLKFVGEA